MNWIAIEARWTHLRQTLSSNWSRLKDDGPMEYDRHAKLVSRIRQVYGLSSDEAERQLQEWERSRTWAAGNTTTP